jgi:hypothetical protein
MQIARMDEEKKNRAALRSDAKQRIVASDAARVAGVLLAEKKAKSKQVSFDYGFKAGMEDPSLEGNPPPDDYDPIELTRGMTAARLLRGAGDTRRRNEDKAARDKELRDLASRLAGDLATTGGDPRPILNDPLKAARVLNPKKLMDMRKYADLLDKREEEGKEDAGLIEFGNALGGLDDVDAVLGAELPSGVDPSKADAMRNARVRALLGKGNADMAAAKWKMQQDRWAMDDERRAAKVAKGDLKGAFDSIGRELDDLAQEIRLGRDTGGTPRNPSKDGVLTARYEQMLQEQGKLGAQLRSGVPSPGAPNPGAQAPVGGPDLGAVGGNGEIDTSPIIAAYDAVEDAAARAGAATDKASYDKAAADHAAAMAAFKAIQDKTPKGVMDPLVKDYLNPDLSRKRRGGR